MRPLNRFVSRVRNAWVRRLADDRLHEEMEQHLALQTDENIRAGMNPPEAYRQARLKFGAIEAIREGYHAEQTLPLIENVLRDARFAVRTLRKAKGFTAAAMLTLALGIGGTVAIFSVVNGVVLKPLPYSDPERLIELRVKAPGISAGDVNASNWGLSQADYFTFREQSRTCEDLGLYDLETSSSGNAVNVTGIGQPEHVPALSVTEGLLPVLGVAPLIGRTFTRADDQPDSPETVMLSYGYWQSKFGGDPGAIGKAIDVDGKPRVIIGVLPKRFRLLDDTKLAMLLPMKINREATQLGGYNFGAVARLKPGVTLEQASADVARMIPITLRSFPPYPGGIVKEFEDLRLEPDLQILKQEILGNAERVLWVLMGGIGLVLLIACANVANLLLLRAEGRLQELAIRAALGASRGHIAAQLLTEGLILSLFGGLLGLALAYGALQVLIAIAPTGLPRLGEIGLDARGLSFSVAVSLLACLLFSSVPILRYTGSGLGIKLRESGRSMSEGRERHRWRSLLVITQVALSLILLVSSGLMIRTFLALTNVDPGFVAPSEVETFRLYVPETQIKNATRVTLLYQEISRQIAAIPGVSSVGISESLPMDGGGYLDGIFVKGRVYPSNQIPLYLNEYVGPGSFETLGTRLVAGRTFGWSDLYNRVPEMMVSEKFAREYWRDPSKAIGEQIGSPKAWREIIGVVGDIHLNGVEKEAPAAVYFPMLATFGKVDSVSRSVAFSMRTPRAGSEGLLNEIQQAVRSVDGNFPLADVRTLGYYSRKSIARTSFMLVMLSLAGGMALLLSVVGLYGVLAYSVAQRTHELGIRIALGAQRRDILRLVLTRGMSLTLIGVGIGITGALMLTRFLSGLLYGVKPNDPVTLVTMSLLLLAITLFATYMPARRAARVDPMTALRFE
jgi:predicted permease